MPPLTKFARKSKPAHTNQPKLVGALMLLGSFVVAAGGRGSHLRFIVEEARPRPPRQTWARRSSTRRMTASLRSRRPRSRQALHACCVVEPVLVVVAMCTAGVARCHVGTSPPHRGHPSPDSWPSIAMKGHPWAAPPAAHPPTCCRASAPAHSQRVACHRCIAVALAPSCFPLALARPFRLAVVRHEALRFVAGHSDVDECYIGTMVQLCYVVLVVVVVIVSGDASTNGQ